MNTTPYFPISEMQFCGSQKSQGRCAEKVSLFSAKQIKGKVSRVTEIKARK